jgi:hypothetical protein
MLHLKKLASSSNAGKDNRTAKKPPSGSRRSGCPSAEGDVAA